MSDSVNVVVEVSVVAGDSVAGDLVVVGDSGDSIVVGGSVAGDSVLVLGRFRRFGSGGRFGTSCVRFSGGGFGNCCRGIEWKGSRG